MEKAREIYRSIKPSLNSYFDTSGSVGRRYARADEIGVYCCVTVDFQSIEDNTVTLRSRDTTKQIRIDASVLKETIQRFMDGEDFDRLGEQVSSK